MKKRMCPGTFSRRGAVASATIYPLRRVRILAERFLSYRNFVSYTIKKRLPQVRQPLNFRQQSVRRSYILLFFISFLWIKS